MLTNEPILAVGRDSRDLNPLRVPASLEVERRHAYVRDMDFEEFKEHMMKLVASAFCIPASCCATEEHNEWCN